MASSAYFLTPEDHALLKKLLEQLRKKSRGVLGGRPTTVDGNPPEAPDVAIVDLGAEGIPAAEEPPGTGSVEGDLIVKAGDGELYRLKVNDEENPPEEFVILPAREDDPVNLRVCNILRIPLSGKILAARTRLGGWVGLPLPLPGVIWGFLNEDLEPQSSASMSVCAIDEEGIQYDTDEDIEVWDNKMNFGDSPILKNTRLDAHWCARSERYVLGNSHCDPEDPNNLPKLKTGTGT